MTPVKEEIADKAFDVLKLVVKDKSIAKEMGEAVAVAVSSTIGAELEVNAERYLRNIYLGENNEISFTDREVVENVIISIAIDEAFELADRGEIELKSGNDLQNIEFDTGKGYDVGDLSNKSTSWYNDDNTINYPPNNGAVFGTEEFVSLKPGEVLGRYGKVGDKSNYATIPGIDYNKLSLPPDTNPEIYQEFVVLKEIPRTIQSEIAPWGDSPGGGTQYELPMTIKELIKLGYIEPK